MSRCLHAEDARTTARTGLLSTPHAALAARAVRLAVVELTTDAAAADAVAAAVAASAAAAILALCSRSAACAASECART